MVITLFFSRLRPDLSEAELQSYRELLAAMKALAEQTPGFVDTRTFTSEDGQRLTVVRFESAEEQLAWRRRPEHRRAQEEGRRRFYAEYSMIICEESRSYAWNPPPASASRGSRPRLGRGT